MTRQRSIAAINELLFPEPPRVEISFPAIDVELDAVFNAKQVSFRELVATILYGRYLDPAYEPRVELYASKPRALYEQGLRPIFQERGIPCGQSGPLNIAKATSALNEQWAAQRRPKPIADATLKIVDWAMKQPETTLLALGAELGRRFDLLAEAVALTQNELPPTTSSVRLANVCRELIEKHPLAGSTPQALCGLALETEFLGLEGFTIDGTRDSASTTNATSKKVGDLTVEHPVAGFVRVYEATVKKFDHQRITDAVQSIRVFFEPEPIPNNFIVQVLCRPEDVPADATAGKSSAHLGEFATGEVVFEFLNIYDWLALKIAEFSLASREHFFTEVQEFLNGGRIPVEVRQTFAAAFAD